MVEAAEKDRKDREAAKRNLAEYTGGQARLTSIKKAAKMEQQTRANTQHAHDQGFLGDIEMVEARTRRQIMRAIEMIEDQHLCHNVVEREVDGIDPITLQEGRHIRYYTRRETAAQQIIREVPIHQVDLLTLNIGHIMRTEFAKKGERIDREVTARYGPYKPLGSARAS